MPRATGPVAAERITPDMGMPPEQMEEDMQLTEFQLDGTRSVSLRPAIVERLAAQIRRAATRDGDAVVLHAGDLADAAGRARDTYRCRHARRDLRQLSLLAVEAVAVKAEVRATGADAERDLLLRAVDG